MTDHRSMSVIHLSDLHCTASAHTLGQIADGVLHRDFQNSGLKLDLLANYLQRNRVLLGTDVIIISGDLTDSGDEEDYADPHNGVVQFITRLRNAGFAVLAVPGNHDYCKEGNQFFTGQVNEGEKARRERFIAKITPQYAAAPKYPHLEQLTASDGSVGAHVILLDSMQEELDGNTDNNRAQGTLGMLQLNSLAELLDGCQPDRALGVKIVVVLHHSPFHDSGDLALSDAALFKNLIKGKVDCLLYGHVTRDFRYQGPHYVSSTEIEQSDEDTAIVDGEAQLSVPLINVVNLEYMGSTLPVTVLDLLNNTRTVRHVRPYLVKIHKVVCNEPATSFGDDLQIYVDQNPVTPAILLDIGHGSAAEVSAALVNSAIQSIQNVVAGERDELKIDKGQTYNLEVEYGVADTFRLTFAEDSDPAGNLLLHATAVAGKGVQIQPFTIKSDGRYDLYYSVEPMPDEVSAGSGGAVAIDTVVDLSGTWSDGSAKSIHISRSFNALTIDMTAYGRPTAFGRVTGSDAVVVSFPDAGMFTGKLAGNRVTWSNSSSWVKRPTHVNVHVGDVVTVGPVEVGIGGAGHNGATAHENQIVVDSTARDHRVH